MTAYCFRVLLSSICDAPRFKSYEMMIFASFEVVEWLANLLVVI